MAQSTRIAIDYTGDVPTSPKNMGRPERVQEQKKKITEIFNDISNDLGRHKVIIEEFSWLAKAAIATVPEEHFHALSKALEPKGFKVSRYTPVKLKPE